MAAMRLLRRPEVETRTGLSRSSIYANDGARRVPPPASDRPTRRGLGRSRYRRVAGHPRRSRPARRPGTAAGEGMTYTGPGTFSGAAVSS